MIVGKLIACLVVQQEKLYLVLIDIRERSQIAALETLKDFEFTLSENWIDY